MDDFTSLTDYCPSCGSYNLVESLESSTSIHFGRISCGECKRHIRWLPKPKIPNTSIARLLHSTGLEPWEKKFLKIVVSRNRSKAEEIVVQTIAEKIDPAIVRRGSC